jgi:hypothetical protein
MNRGYAHSMTSSVRWRAYAKRGACLDRRVVHCSARTTLLHRDQVFAIDIRAPRPITHVNTSVALLDFAAANTEVICRLG